MQKTLFSLWQVIREFLKTHNSKSVNDDHFVPNYVCKQKSGFTCYFICSINELKKKLKKNTGLGTLLVFTIWFLATIENKRQTVEKDGCAS